MQLLKSNKQKQKIKMEQQPTAPTPNLILFTCRIAIVLLTYTQYFTEIVQYWM